MKLRVKRFFMACTVFAPQALIGHAYDSPIPDRLPSETGIYKSTLDTQVEALLKKMTLEEKVGQLVQYSAGQPTGPGTGRADSNDMIALGQVGALLNVVKPEDVNAYQRLAVENSRLNIPLLFGLDVIHGYRTVFPIPLGLASTWDLELIEQAARISAREASAVGIRWTFSPMVDIARDPRWGRIAESSGEDPLLGSAIAAAYIRGYQGARLDAVDSIAACAKHYVGYGAAEGGRDYNTTDISEQTLRTIYLPPFRAAVNAGSATIMSAFNALNGVPTSANPFTLTQVLRHEWGFRGLVDSDWASISELMAHGVANDEATAARKALLAGVDMDMGSNLYHKYLLTLVRSGRIPEGSIDESVRRVLRVKFSLGLFNRPYVDESKATGAMLSPEAVTLARIAAERSFVLLKNTPIRNGGPLLPFSDGDFKIALIGPLADDPHNMLGTWADQGRSEDVISLYSALSQRIPAERLVYVKGTDISEGTAVDLEAARAAAGRADVIVLALGESSEMSGEAASRAHLTLPGRQQELFDKVFETGKPLVLVLFSGRPLVLPTVFEKAPAVIAAWAPGIQAGPALVRVLFGEVVPSGRLAVSWPRAVGQIPLYYNSLSTGRPFGVGGDEKFSPRYIDERRDPEFSFGFGLSYTTFSYGPVELKQKELRASILNSGLTRPESAPAITASSIITNSGSMRAQEVVQLYVRLEGASTAQPVRTLKGFKRIELSPGESRKITFDLKPSTFAIWDMQNRYTVEPTRVTIWIAPDANRGSNARLDILP
jgi:beta-glucosidase